MLLVVPAVLQPQLTNIVLLPLNSLLADYKRKFAEMQISCQEWRPASPLDITASMPLDVNIVLVTFDQAVTPAFQAAVKQLGSTAACLFVDEFHYASTAVSYRPVMRQLRHLRAAGALQMVLMSGSIPPEAEGDVFKAFDLIAEPTVIRVSTVRPESKYVFEQPRSRDQLVQRAVYIISSYTLQMTGNERGLVYVQSIDMLNQIKGLCTDVRFYISLIKMSVIVCFMTQFVLISITLPSDCYLL